MQAVCGDPVQGRVVQHHLGGTEEGHSTFLRRKGADK